MDLKVYVNFSINLRHSFVCKLIFHERKWLLNIRIGSTIFLILIIHPSLVFKGIKDFMKDIISLQNTKVH